MNANDLRLLTEKVTEWGNLSMDELRADVTGESPAISRTLPEVKGKSRGELMAILVNEWASTLVTE